MKAINLHRRDRALRFGAFGLLMGASVYVSLVLVLNLFAFILGMERFPSNLSQVTRTVVSTALVSASFGTICAVVGALTARVSARLWGWRILGIFCILLSVGLFAWAWISASPDAIGWTIITAVSLIGVAIGYLTIDTAQKRSLDPL